MIELIPWLKAFALTEVVEGPIYRRLGPTSWAVALGASAITHPFVWFGFPLLGFGWLTTTIASELFAFAVEAVFVRFTMRVTWKRAVAVSLLANGASVTVGLVLRAATGWV